VTDFARRTGDLAVLSTVDLEIAALAYEVECEENGGDWRLRSRPGAKLNGPIPITAPMALTDSATLTSSKVEENGDGVGDENKEDGEGVGEEHKSVEDIVAGVGKVDLEEKEKESINIEKAEKTVNIEENQKENMTIEEKEEKNVSLEEGQTGYVEKEKVNDKENTETDESDESEGGEWITPTNLLRKQAQESNNSSSTPATSTSKSSPRITVATLTTDHALQNLLLQINLNLLSPSLTRITNIRTTLLRCHACFLLHKKPNLQFCQRCGKPTLTRVTCTTDSKTGEIKVHLKKNMQWNHRGDRYSIPKPVAGASNGKRLGGGKDGWGNDLVLVEDQKEAIKAAVEKDRQERRTAKGLERDGVMDLDYLPGLVSGIRKDDRQYSGKMKVGAGRNVNSKKR